MRRNLTEKFEGVGHSTLIEVMKDEINNKLRSSMNKTKIFDSQKHKWNKEVRKELQS